MFKQLLPAFRMTLLFTLVTGVAYPALVTAFSQALFSDKANGSIVSRAGRPVGSSLIGQGFAKPEYFHPRPSAAGANGFDGASSSGSNLGPTSQKLFDRLKASEQQFRQENPDFHGQIPSDALTTSASGLDPHISPGTAKAQIGRVANARSADPAQLEQLVDRLTEARSLGFLGEPRVNVLILNLALDQEFPARK